MLQWFILLNFLVEFGSSQIPPGCDVTTTTGYRYSQFHHLHSSPDGTMELRFRVMAKSDAHIVLTTSPLVLNPLYEIVIGASGNNYTDLRRTMTGRSVSAVKTPSLLSDSEFRGFWVVARQGEIEVGREGETLPYFHWKDADPLPVHYYSLSSWTSTVAKWIQNCDFGGKTSWLTPSDNSSTEDNGSLGPQSEESYYNAEEKLKANLLATYNKDVRPATDHRTPVSVFLGLSLVHFDLNELTSSFDIHSTFKMSWRDERLKWNSSAYENVTLLHFPSHTIWQPDLKLFNGVVASDIIHFGEGTSNLVFPDGAIMLAPPPISLSTMCPLDLRMWPWDTQKCTFIIGSWTHSGLGIDLKLSNIYGDTELIPENALYTHNLYVTNLQWELKEFNASIHKFNDCPENDGSCSNYLYPEAHFSFIVRRKSPLYIATVTVPALMLTVLTLVTFALPPNSLEKVLIGSVNLLVLSIFLIYLSSLLPPMGDHMPLVVSYLSKTLVMVVLSLVLAVVTITITRTPRMYGPPYWIKNILTGVTGKILGLQQIITLVNRVNGDRTSRQQQSTDDYTLHVDAGDHDVNLVNTSTDQRIQAPVFRGAVEAMNPAELEWLLLAYGLDRLAFIIYFFTFMIMMAMCF
ncbi:acetylcholine receptor subunit alpha-like [Daphnia pulex]|uniref:acetylcholine receptor subunit alpha-like n=1 Tax=Daphnia pulex TaxID=6669 RepID=UPI001EDE7088|nr:acetylcholine receptor subunit alpha-like [Daphnia pulex]